MIKSYLTNVSNGVCLALQQLERCKSKINALQEENLSEDAEELYSAYLEYEFWQQRYMVQKQELQAIIEEIQDKNYKIELTDGKELLATLITLNENVLPKIGQQNN